MCDNIGIEISSNRPEEDDTSIEFVDDEEKITSILADENIIKLHYQNSAKFGCCHKNWGETKGEDHYKDVCVMLNKTTAKKRIAGKLFETALN